MGASADRLLPQKLLDRVFDCFYAVATPDDSKGVRIASTAEHFNFGTRAGPQIGKTAAAPPDRSWHGRASQRAVCDRVCLRSFGNGVPDRFLDKLGILF